MAVIACWFPDRGSVEAHCQAGSSGTLRRQTSTEETTT
jgi:hypothetical protein